jgi:hypothetical protein
MLLIAKESDACGFGCRRRLVQLIIWGVFTRVMPRSGEAQLMVIRSTWEESAANTGDLIVLCKGLGDYFGRIN